MTLALDVRMARTRLERDPESAGPFLERLGEELSRGLGGAARARPRHPPRGADRARPGAGDRGARGARAGAGRGRSALPGERLPAAAEATAYFTVSEALTNVAKYAQASTRPSGSTSEDDALVVEVHDDGVGGAQAGTGSGLSGLADRVGACDGSLSVTSPRGRGHAGPGGAAARGGVRRAA